MIIVFEMNWIITQQLKRLQVLRLIKNTVWCEKKFAVNFVNVDAFVFWQIFWIPITWIIVLLFKLHLTTCRWYDLYVWDVIRDISDIISFWHILLNEVFCCFWKKTSRCKYVRVFCCIWNRETTWMNFWHLTGWNVDGDQKLDDEFVVDTVIESKSQFEKIQSLNIALLLRLDFITAVDSVQFSDLNGRYVVDDDFSTLTEWWSLPWICLRLFLCESWFLRADSRDRVHRVVPCLRTSLSSWNNFFIRLSSCVLMSSVFRTVLLVRLHSAKMKGH